MDPTRTKFTPTCGTARCPLCGEDRRFWHRPRRAPHWLYWCQACGVTLYGDQPRDLARYMRIMRRGVARNHVPLGRLV